MTSMSSDEVSFLEKPEGLFVQAGWNKYLQSAKQALRLQSCIYRSFSVVCQAIAPVYAERSPYTHSNNMALQLMPNGLGYSGSGVLAVVNSSMHEQAQKSYRQK